MMLDINSPKSLNVNIISFSYKKGTPEDSYGNGGGFVFDCRGILNPGRIEAYKIKTGRDFEVAHYLEKETRMPDFLTAVYAMVDITVQAYVARGFEHLQIAFGCTGGQHRSVYAADRLAAHLQQQNLVEVTLFHREQERKKWINEPY